MSQLFTSLQIGRTTVRNRLVMAPMTRSRSDDEGVPSDLVAHYYGQRASAGLIITEGVFPTSMGKGYVRTPGIETSAQVAAWQGVVEAVHAKGGRIFMQLMHCGRISHPSLISGETPVAPSAIKPAGQAWTPIGQVDYVTPRALSLVEIAEVTRSYALAARRAIDAGFDGVELHAASGYLPEQFLSSNTNQRQDLYGGSVQNRSRFILEVLDAMVEEVGAGRVGIKIAPEMNFNDINDAAPVDTYTYLVDQLRGFDLAYLHVAQFRPGIDYHSLLRPHFNGPYLAGGGLDKRRAETLLAERLADAAVFGGAFLANPDLPERLRLGAALNTPDKSTFYSEGAKGYVDYPYLNETIDA